MSVDVIWILCGIVLAILLDWWVLRRRLWRPIVAGLKSGPVTAFKRQPLAVTLFGLALLVYAVTRWIGLDKFPIYFFCDEAAQTVLAADLVSRGLRDPAGHFLPPFFKNGFYYNLGTSVYLQVLPYLLLGKSVVVTRGVSVLMSLSGAAAVGLTLREAFKARWWWVGVMLLSITPAWFLHSRTAFETVTMASLYAWFVYFYALYRQRDPRYLFAALVCGALAFYSYNPGQVVVTASGVLLLLSDWRYHWANRKIGGLGVALLCVLALPYVCFWLEHPDDTVRHLSATGSYWLQDWSLPRKLGQFLNEYTFGLDPRYWYSPVNTRDLVRHVMKGYGHILLATLPLALLGLVTCLRQWRSWACRLVLAALLAAPAGGALADNGVTRALVLVIPATLLTALGLEAIQGWIARRISTAWLAVGVFVALSVVNASMLRDALVNGPTWYTDYSLYGMQYGAQQVFAEIAAYQRQSPDTLALLSPMWSNGTNYHLQFFKDDYQRVRLESVYNFLGRPQRLDETVLFIMTPEEYREVTASPKFEDVRVERTLPYPNGQTGFYFARLRYSSAASALFAQEELARRELATAIVSLQGQRAQVRHSKLDSGQVEAIFDGNPLTLGRVEEANPAIFELTFPLPVTASRISVIVNVRDVGLRAQLFASGNDAPVVFSQTYMNSPHRAIRLNVGGPSQVARLHLEILALNEPGGVKIHVYDIVVQ